MKAQPSHACCGTIPNQYRNVTWHLVPNKLLRWYHGKWGVSFLIKMDPMTFGYLSVTTPVTFMLLVATWVNALAGQIQHL